MACLFIDVVGSTELTMRLGSERLKAALGSAFAELRALIERQGGTVEKYVGDEIYALFGAPIAHEDDPARALRAAEAVRAWGRSQGSAAIPFSVRVGLEVGEAIVDLAATEGARQQMSVGAVVNVASRLQSYAEPGEVLVGPVAHGATEEIATYRDMGEVELKGLGRTPAWQLEEIRGEALRRSLPFVGRQSELELLRLAYRRAKTRSVLALVSGPPGQGKTRLVDEFCSTLGDARIMKARSRPGGEVGALAPLRELLLGDRPGDELDAVVARAISDDGERPRVRDALAHSAGIVASTALAAVGKDERDDEIQNAWRRLVHGLTGEGPALIWIEDIHWAANEVVRLVDRLSLSGDPLLVIVTARPEFAEGAGLRPGGDRFFIELDGLEMEDARALATSAGSTDEGRLARAEGNPLFVVELARAQEPESGLPLTLQGALGARLDELHGDDRILLARAAVVGETFAASEAAFLAGRPADDVGRALGRLTDRHYVDRVDGRFRFHHSLVRDVAYGRLLVADRMRLHARYAREATGRDDADVVAHHWWAALGGADAEWVWRDDPEVMALRGRAFRAQFEAGRRSGELFALDRAVPFFDRAFTLATDEAQRGDARRALADALALDLRGDEAWGAYRQARDHYLAAGAVPLQLYVGALKIRMRVGAFNQTPPLAEVRALEAEAEASARAAGDPAVLARTLVYSAFNDSDPASAEGGDRERILEALRLAESADLATRQEVLGWYARALLGNHELDQAGAVLDELEQLPVATNELDQMERLRGRALLALRAADLDTLQNVSERLVTMSRRMGPHLRSHADVHAAEAAFASGRWDAVIGMGNEMAHLVRSSPGTAFCSAAGLVLAAAAAANARAGRAEEARALATLIGTTRSEAQGVHDLRGFALVFTGRGGGPERPHRTESAGRHHRGGRGRARSRAVDRR